MAGQNWKEKRKLSSAGGQACRRAVEALESRLLFAAHIAGSSTVYSTIQNAVDAASAGDTITVDAGTYGEQVDVWQPLTIQGAQAGMDARSNSRKNDAASESIVTGAVSGSVHSSAFYINANDVTIDGFTVQGETNSSDATGAGIVIAPGRSGTTVINNIVQDNVSGLFLANASSTDAALIQHNLFRDNNNDGENGGRGIYTDESISGGNLTNVTIDSNTFTGNFGGDGTTNLEAACAFEASVPGEQSHITITNNVMNSNGKAALFLNATNIAFNGNTVTGCQDQYSGSIRFEGNVQNVTIENNNVHDNWGPGVAVDSKGTPGSSSGFTVSGNDFVNSNAAYGVPISVVYDASSYDGAFNAAGNWWGSASGPSGDGPGSGDAVSAGHFQPGNGLGWALNSGGDTVFSPWSASPNTNNASPPTAPASLTATANSATKVTLKWTDTAVGVENGFVVQRSTDSKTFTTIGTTASGVVTYADTQATASTAYTYRVYATNSVGDSPYSSTATVTTPAAVVVTAPTGLTAAALSSSQIKLTWTDTAAAVETGFVIQRSVGGGAFVQVATTTKGITACNDTGLAAGTSYTYRVEATSAGGASAWSTTATIKTPAVATAPTALTAVALLPTQVKLTWTDTASTVETGFIIERSAAGGVFVDIGTAAAHTTTFTDKNVSPGTAYSYRVLATSVPGVSAFSAAVTITTHLPATAPTSLAAAAISQTQVHLSWKDSASGIETGFIVQRGVNGTTFAQIGTTLAGVAAFEDKAAAAGSTYYYRVLAISAAGNSPASIAVKFTTAALPKAPTSVSASVKSSTHIVLAWAHTTGVFETGFIVQRSTDGVNFTQIGTTGVGILTYSDPTALPGVAYSYRVQTSSLGGNSLFSAIIKAAKTASVAHPTLAAAPTGFKSTAASATLVNLSWTNPSGTTATGFAIQRSTDGVHFTQIGATAAGVLTYADHTALAVTSYVYRVQSTSTAGGSMWSKTIAVKTSAVPLPTAAKAPATLKAVAASSTQIDLSWTNPAGATAIGFIIQRSTDGVHYTQIGMTSAAVLAFIDHTAVAGVTYDYRVQATSNGGNSAFSNVASVKAPALAALPVAKAPTGLKTAVASTTQVNLTWTDAAIGVETGFVIERSADGVTFTMIATTAAGVVAYADHAVTHGTNYSYKVIALSAGGASAGSAVATAKP